MKEFVYSEIYIVADNIIKALFIITKEMSEKFIDLREMLTSRYIAFHHIPERCIPLLYRR